MATTKRSSAKTSQSAGNKVGQTCWPGYKRVPGTKAGTKGSCEPKAKQTAAEKRADSRAAAASKREKSS